jgi:hypothetical protein
MAELRLSSVHSAASFSKIRSAGRFSVVRSEGLSVQLGSVCTQVECAMCTQVARVEINSARVSLRLWLIGFMCRLWLIGFMCRCRLRGFMCRMQVERGRVAG